MKNIRKIAFLVLLASLPALAGAQKTYKLGDYYPDPDNSSTAIGIVFWLDSTGTSGKMVSLDEAGGIRWGESDVEEYKTIPEVADPDKGEQATRGIFANKLSYEHFATKYASFNWVLAKNGGDPAGMWYLPSRNELKALYAYYCGMPDVDWGDNKPFPGYDSPEAESGRKTFNDKVSAAGGTPIAGSWHLTSNEFPPRNAWYVSMFDGTTWHNYKDYYNHVRAIAKF